MPTLRVVIDANIPDWMYKYPAAREAMRVAVQDGRLELLVEPVVIGQVSRIGTGVSGTPEKRQACLEIIDELCTRIPMAGAPFGVGPFGEGRFGGSPPAQQPIVQAARGNTQTNAKLSHESDATIAATAHRLNATLATSEKRLRNAAKRIGVPVLTKEELFALAGFDLAAAEAADPSSSTSASGDGE